MDYSALKFWFDVVVAFMLFGNWVYLWLTNRQRVNKAEITKLTNIVGGIESRVTKVEEQMKNAPTHSDLSNIYNRINGMGKDLSEMTGAVKAMTTQLTLINEHLLKRGN